MMSLMKFIHTSELNKKHFTKLLRKNYGIKVLKEAPAKPMKREEVYVGDWKDGEMHGEGKHIAPNGANYEGEFVNGERHGKGRLESCAGVYLEIGQRVVCMARAK